MLTELMTTPVEITLILEDEMRRYGVEGMFRSLDSVRGVHCFKSVTEAATAMANRDIDVLVTAGATPADEAAQEVISSLCDRNVPLLVLIDDDGGVGSAWASKAQGFLAWSELSPDTLHAAVTDAMNGRFHVSAALARRLFSGEPPAARAQQSKPATGLALTARELQVLHLVAEGLSNKQVAQQLAISENGVKRVMGNVLAKLNSPNRTLAVVRGLELGLLNL